MEETTFILNIPLQANNIVDLPPDIIKKIIIITNKGNDATVKRKKDGYKVYETKLIEK